MLGIEILKRMGGGTGSSFGSISAYVSGAKYTEWTIDPNGFTYQYIDLSNPGTPSLVQGPAWISPVVGVGDYEIKATLLSGNVPPGTFNSWLNLATARSWGWENQTLYKYCELKVEIRRVSGGAIVSTAFITLENNGTV